MSMNMIKIEESILPVRRRRCMPGGGAPEVTRAKRRRRDAADVVTGNVRGENGLMTTVKRSSRFRGVSRHRWTGRYEAHLWDKLSWNVTQKKRGKQVYLGAYDDEEAAARAYDLAALKYWGTSTFTNFPIPEYEQEIQIMQTVTKEEYLASLRRKSSGFSRGLSKYRGVARHHHNGRWEARIGRVFGNKYPYLGTYSTQEEAARAYDLAAIEHRGINAVTNFDLSNYITCLNPLAKTANPPQEAKPSTNMLQSHLQAVKQLQIPLKKEMYDAEVPFRSYRRPSSPTALGLLLRSSVFKKLVEKNSNLSEEESSDDENTKSLQQTSSNEEYGVLFNDIPFMFSSNGVDDMPYIGTMVVS